MRTFQLCAFFAAALVAPLSVLAAGGPYKLIASDAAAADKYGAAVAISGDTAVIGAETNDGDGPSAGAAYVARWTGLGWAEEARLAPTDAAAALLFGSAVAIDGSTIVVGARFGDGAVSDSGAAYVFARAGSTWTQEAKLSASDGALSDEFGASVSVSGDTIVVGAKGDDDVGSSSGAAYVFTRIAGVWTEQAKLASSDLAAVDQFGISVTVNEDTIVVGAETNDGLAGADQGAVYVFVRSAGVWAEQQKLTASDAAGFDRFGSAVDVHGDTLVVGSPLHDDGGISRGAAYVFTRTAGVWTEEQELLVSEGPDGARFGDSVAIDADTVIVGAYTDDGGAGADQGAAYVFARSGGVWTQQMEHRAPDADAGDHFGVAVAIDSDLAVVGANLDDDTVGIDQGSAYIFERAGEVWVGSAQNILASDAGPGDQFGYAVAIDGDTAIVGAPIYEDMAGESEGAAYVFVRVGTHWVEQAKLIPADPSPNSLFGNSVAIDGDTVIVGSYLKSGPSETRQGAAYVFVRNGSTWSEQAKLSAASDADPFDGFGFSTAIDGDTVIVGVPTNGSKVGVQADEGLAYAYTRSGTSWTEQGKLIAAFGVAGDAYGWSVAVEGDTAFMGSANSDSVRIFTRSGSTWTDVAELERTDALGGELFGESISLDGDSVIVGASWRDLDGGTRQGAAYVFTGSGASWSQQALLTAPDPVSGDNFGRSVSVSGDTAVIGAPRVDIPGAEDQGAAYVFERRGSFWTLHAKIASPDGAAGDFFGSSIAVDGKLAIVGAEYDDDAAGVNQGSALMLCVAPDCLPPSVFDVSRGIFHPSFSDAFVPAGPFDEIVSSPAAFWSESTIDPGTLPLFVDSVGRIRTPHTTELVVSANSLVSSSPASPVTLYGDTAVKYGGSLHSGASMNNFGALSLLGGGLSASAILNDGSLSGAGGITGDTTNDGDVVVQADMQFYGDYTNNGTTTIQNGTLTILGTLTDNGTIIGDFATTRSAPGGFFVDEDYNAGAGSSLLLTGGIAKFGANADIAIDDKNRFNMAISEVRMVGLSGTTQTYELMSTDIGADSDGLDRTMTGHYPIGTLRIGPTPTTVNLVDVHDNDQLGQGAKEALYVNNLVIDAGAMLNTNGCPVYYETLTNNGSVDNPANLIQIAACVADLTGDGVVDGADLATLLAQWGTNGSADLTGDGNVDGADLAALLAAWGACS